MKLLRKMLSAVLIISLISSLSLSLVSAEEIFIGINDDDAAFEEVMCVRNGITYIPLRMAFPNFNDRNNHMGMTITYSPGIIHIIYGSTTGEDYRDVVENGKEVRVMPYNAERKCVDLVWGQNAYAGTLASYSYIKYSKLDENRIPLDSKVQSIGENSIRILLKPLQSGGDRMYISIDDAMKISKWLGLDERYSVKLYDVK